MPRRRAHRVSDIAAQSGLSRATVDRVLHGRQGVRPETIAQVERAIEELGRQHSQVHLSTRTLILDVVMQAPQRFTAECRSALELELSMLRPAVARARFHLAEHSDPFTVAELLERITHRGSQGVILKGPDHPVVREAVNRLAAREVPTVTFATDVSQSARVAYVGVDNRAAGSTAAYLVNGWGDSRGGVLVTLSSSTFRGEEERQVGLTSTLATLAPSRAIHQVAETDGLDATMFGAVIKTLRDHTGIDAVYSAGGGNRAILSAYDALGRRPRVFVAHDLDADNRGLLRTRRLTAVLHHDLKADMRRACRLLLQAGGLLPGRPLTLPSQVQVVTPYNEPATMRDD